MGGGGGPAPKSKNVLRQLFLSIISLSTLKISAKSFCRNIDFTVRVFRQAVSFTQLSLKTRGVPAIMVASRRVKTEMALRGGPFFSRRLPSRHTHRD